MTRFQPPKSKKRVAFLATPNKKINIYLRVHVVPPTPATLVDEFWPSQADFASFLVALIVVEAVADIPATDDVHSHVQSFLQDVSPAAIKRTINVPDINFLIK